MVFLLGTVVGMYFEFSLKNFLLTVRQITWQSNFFALILSSLCLWKPYLSFLTSNYLFIICASMLTTSTVIFSFLLFPIYLNLNIFYFAGTILPAWVEMFWNIWNHFVTLTTFLNLLSYRYRDSQDKKSVKEWLFQRKSSLFRYLVYWLINLLLNVYFSFDNSQALPYGAVANWSWKRTLDSAAQGALGTSSNLPIPYSFQLSFFSFFIVMAVVIFSLFSYLAFLESRSKECRWKKLHGAISPCVFSRL